MLDVQPLTEERWEDAEKIFLARGCSVARGCWCMYYRERGKAPSREERKDRFRGLVGKDPPLGLIGYREGEPVGWVSVGPREEYVKLENSPVMKRVDETPVWSVICFVVPVEFRRQGVARALLDGAIQYARGRGVEWLEAYPLDKRGERGKDDWYWLGTLGMYEKAGFVEVARRKPERPVVRLRILGDRGNRHCGNPGK